MVRAALTLGLTLALASCASRGDLALDPLAAERALVLAGRFDDAAAKLTPERLGALPRRHRGDGHALLAHCFEAAGRVDDALHAYQYAVGVFPKNLEILNGLAWLLHHQGLDDRALPLFRRVVRAHEKNASGNLGLAEILRAQGDLAGAQACYERTLEEDGWRTAGTLRDYAEVLAARQRFDAAARAVAQSLSLSPAPDTLLAAARIERRRGRDAEAYARLGEALAAAPERTDVRLQRALWCLEDARLGEAEAEAEAVLAKAEGDALARWVRGVVRARRGDMPGARADLAAAAARRREHPFIARAALALLEELHAPAD